MNISIITACYNSAATIADTVRTVAQQDYEHIEHLIIDGLSTDNTLAIVKAAGHAGPVFSEKDNGIYDAMNKGIQKASGDIIGILNSDDFYADNNVLNNVANVFKTTGCDALYGDLWYVQAQNIQTVTRKWVAGSFLPKQFLYGWMPPHPTFFVKKEVYNQYGLFNLNLGSAADYELMLRFLYRYRIKTAYLPQVMVHMRQGGASNKTLQNRIKANRNDKKAWQVNHLQPLQFTFILKPLRKITQFF